MAKCLGIQKGKSEYEDLSTNTFYEYISVHGANPLKGVRISQNYIF